MIGLGIRRMEIEMTFAPCALAVLTIVLSFSPFFVGFGGFELFEFCTEFVGVLINMIGLLIGSVSMGRRKTRIKTAIIG